jgi:hypothetical protein
MAVDPKMVSSVDGVLARFAGIVMWCSGFTGVFGLPV